MQMLWKRPAANGSEKQQVPNSQSFYLKDFGVPGLPGPGIVLSHAASPGCASAYCAAGCLSVQNTERGAAPQPGAAVFNGTTVTCTHIALSQWLSELHL